MTDDALVERIAATCHEAWMHWSTTISIKEHIGVDRLHRWQKRWVPYDHLSEAEKAKDRMWARKIIAIIKEEKTGGDR